MWTSPAIIPALKSNQGHLWKIDSRTLKCSEVSCFSVLSEDEKARADKFRFRRDRFIYVLARGVLRKLLASYIGKAANQIDFEYNEQGKPSVQSASNVKFNVSHSRDMILIGFTRKADIGVDIEWNKRPIEIREVAKSFFSDREELDLFSLVEKDRLSAFYNCWTRKEAFIKAKGGGLSIPLDQFEVSLKPHSAPRLLSVLWDQTEVSKWNMKSFNIEKDYTCAVVTHNDDLTRQHYDGLHLLLTTN